MSPVKYNQKGYIGQSMSVRASLAYEKGEKPLSKMKKEDRDYLNLIISTYAPHLELPALNLKTTKLVLKKWGETSWHHTGKFAIKTSFYHPCALFDIFEPEIWEEELDTHHLEIFFQRMERVKEYLSNQETEL